MKKKKKLFKFSGTDSFTPFDLGVTLLVVLITIIVAYPLYFCIIASFSDPEQVALGNTLLWVKEFTLEAYQNIVREKDLWIGYKNTIIYVVLATLYNLVLTIPSAYVLTKKNLPFHGVISWFFFITMYINGGLIPNYLLIKNLGLLDNPLVMIVGSGVSCYNLIVARQFFSSTIPGELYEAAKIDGASEFKCFSAIALPLAKPIIAVLTLYYGVSHWNGYYNALIYLRHEKYFPLQLVLRNILIQNQLATVDSQAMDATTMEYVMRQAYIAQGMKYAIIFIASAPLLIIYPFLQKYFEKGIMIGSVKG